MSSSKDSFRSACKIRLKSLIEKQNRQTISYSKDFIQSSFQQIAPLSWWKKKQNFFLYLAEIEGHEPNLTYLIQKLFEEKKSIFVPNWKHCQQHPNIQMQFVQLNEKNKIETFPLFNRIPMPEISQSECPNYPVADVIFIPGIAFDAQGNRIGRGKGCYDRWLRESLKNSPIIIGCCIEEALIEKFPFVPSKHDIPMDWIMTVAASNPSNQRLIKCKRPNSEANSNPNSLIEPEKRKNQSKSAAEPLDDPHPKTQR